MNQKRNVFGSPGLRLLQLYALMCSNNRKYSLARLANLFRCSRQTILRMTDQLQRVAGISLHTWIEKGERYFQIHRGRGPALVSLDVESIRHLMLCRDIVRHLLPKPLQQEIRDTIGAAAILLSESAQNKVELDSHAEAWGKGTIDYTPFQKHLEDLQEAMGEHRLCRLQYRSRSNTRPKSYYVGPLRLIAFREALYVGGPVFKDDCGKLFDSQRTFAVHRISSLTVLKAKFVPPDDDQDHEFFGFHFDDPFRVRVAFHGQAAGYVAERTWSRDQRIVSRKNGGVELTFTSTSRPEVISWILSFGPDAELLAPKHLRNVLRQQVEEILARYMNENTGQLRLNSKGKSND